MKPLNTFFICLSICLTFSTTYAQDVKTYDDGIAKFRAGDYAGVIQAFSDMLANSNRNKRYDEDLYFYRAQSFYHTGEIDKSLADLDKCVELNHFNKGVINWYRARCYVKKGNAAQADTYYKDALAAAEKNKKLSAQILADRSRFYAQQGDKVAAAQDLEQAKSLDPTNKDIAQQKAQPTTVASRTAGDKNNTQVIIKGNNTTAQKKEEKAESKQTVPPPANKEDKTQQTQSTTQPTQPVTNPNVAMVANMAEIYKDEKRFALIIGNSNYPNTIGVLKNPVNDATDIATELRKSNFEVQLLTNATYVQIREAVRKFHEKLVAGPKDQTVGLFYYAGHGVQYQDENYLVPIDANVQFEDDIVRMCFPVQRMVLANMERSNSRMNIVILDACRNNPFPAANRSVSQGLAEMKRARGSFIAYATAPGSVASDGAGRNGLYTQELLKALRKPGLTIEQVFKEVRMNVLHLSGDKQFTWDSSNIVGEFFFKLQ